jgi:hypothetical protein
MADTKTWKLSEIRERVREWTGRRSTEQVTDVEFNKIINDYWVNHFPSDARVDEFNGFYTQALSATDDGVYSIAQNIDRLDDPVTINGRRITLYRDRELFFGDYDPRHYLHGHFHSHFIGTRTHLHGQYKAEQYITNPTLAIGTSDTTKVKHSDFSYEVQSKSYSKSSSEVALTGSDIPTELYGAWSLRIDEDGTITVAAANDNATGYATPRIALDALTPSDSESAYMGYVTVTKSDGAFTPATTSLSAANVTATYTDGRFENRAEPTAALLYGQNLYVLPKSNDIKQFEALTIADRPPAFADDDAVPDDSKWGPAIAAMAAILFLEPKGEEEKAKMVAVAAEKYMSSIRLDEVKRTLSQVVPRSF